MYQVNLPPKAGQSYSHSRVEIFLICRENCSPPRLAREKLNSIQHLNNYLNYQFYILLQSAFCRLPDYICFIRLSAEEKYAQEIELALRMSMNSAEEIPAAKTEVTVPSSEVSPNIENQNTQVVEAEVLNSPNSKPNKSSERTEEKRLCIVNK